MTTGSGNRPVEKFMQAYNFSAELEKMEEAHRQEMRGLLLRVLEVRDSMRNVTEELRQKHAETGKHDDGLLRRFDLIDRQFELALEASQVRSIESVGKEADPLIHHIVKTVKRKDEPHGMIVEEKMKGYMVKDEILRRPQVVVVVKK
jgi:molecular chaperone GrpE